MSSEYDYDYLDYDSDSDYLNYDYEHYTNNYQNNTIKIKVKVHKTNCDVCMKTGIPIVLGDDIQDCIDCLTSNINFNKEEIINNARKTV